MQGIATSEAASTGARYRPPRIDRPLRAAAFVVAVGLNGAAIGLVLAHRPEPLAPATEPRPVTISLVQAEPVQPPRIEPPRPEPKPRPAPEPKPEVRKPDLPRPVPPKPLPPKPLAQPKPTTPPPVIASRSEAPSPVIAPPPAPVVEAPPPAPVEKPPAPVVEKALPPAPVAAAPAPSPSPTPAPVVAPRFDAAYLSNPAPTYPAIARRMGEQGKVVLRVVVTADGRAEQVEVRSSSGSSRLDRAAADAVARWRFVPARRGAEAVSASVLVPINFALDG